MRNTSDKTNRISRAFSIVLAKYEITGSKLAHTANVQPKQISVLKCGSRDLSVKTFDRIVRALPETARKDFLRLAYDENITAADWTLVKNYL